MADNEKTAVKTKSNKPSFWQGVKREWNKIIWPKREDLVKQTGLVVVHDHIDEHVAGEHLPLHDLRHAVLRLLYILERNADVENLVLKVAVADRLLDVGLHLVFIT